MHHVDFNFISTLPVCISVRHKRPKEGVGASDLHAALCTHMRLQGWVASGVRTRSVEQWSYGAASTAAQEGRLSATQAKAVKMATKLCPVAEN